MKLVSARLLRWLWAATAAMLFGLAGLIAFVHFAVSKTDLASHLIVDDSAPDIVTLQAASADLSRLRSVLRDALHPGADPSAQRALIADGQRALAQDVERWFALPIEPGEAEVMNDLKTALGRFDDVIHRILALTPASPPVLREDLRAELDATAYEIDQVVLRGSTINVEIARRATGDIRDVAGHLLPAAVVLDAVSVILAVVALAAAYRASRAESALAEQRILQRKNAELEAFSARVAHDVLSPLMTVSLALGLAEDRLAKPGDERVHGMIVRAASSLQRVRRVVSDLLEFARAAATPPPGIETEVAPLLESLVHDLEPIAIEAGVDLRLTGAAPVRVRCAEGILSSILTNLVQNAIRHAGRDEPHVDVRALDAGREVLFEVEDTGSGVLPGDRERIFEPYVRATDEGPGLGLGLATVKRLAESHGGHVGVRVSSPESHGALFWVTLPTAA